MRGGQILSALIGLVGAISNNGKTANTDRIVLDALRGMNEDETEQKRLADEVRKEKFCISPSCARCVAPCGNTSDYDISKFSENPEEVQRSKQSLYNALYSAAMRIEEGGVLPDCVYQGICYLAFELDPMLYREIEEEIEKC